jgi:glycosyltransferase involved in cell wall biosynthesis
LDWKGAWRVWGYRSCDAVVTTDLEAGWCNTAAEAMACGIPVVCSRHGTVDFAEDGRTAIVLPHVSADTVAAALSRLHSSRALARDIGARGAAAMRRFAITRYAGDLLQIIGGWRQA